VLLYTVFKVVSETETFSQNFPTVSQNTVYISFTYHHQNTLKPLVTTSLGIQMEWLRSFKISLQSARSNLEKSASVLCLLYCQGLRNKDFLSRFTGIFLINIRLFCHYFWTRNATKSIKPSKDSHYSLESNKTLSHEIGSIYRLPGGDNVIKV